VCLAVCVVGLVAAQDAASTLKDLNALLARSCARHPVLTMGGDGTVVRTDRDGAAITFKFDDIGEIAEAPREDAEANVLLPCKGDQPCVQWTPGPGQAKTSGKLVVFSLYPATEGPQVVKLLRDLQTAAAVGKKSATGDAKGPSHENR
jgi:hypothetical protein